MKLVDYIKTLADGDYLLKTTRGYVYVAVRTHECMTNYSRQLFQKAIRKYKHAVVIDAEECRYAMVYDCAEYSELCAGVKKPSAPATFF